MTVLELIEILQKLPDKQATVLITNYNFSSTCQLEVEPLREISWPNSEENLRMDDYDWYHPLNRYYVLK